MILYLVVLASLLGLIWIIYMYCVVPVSDFERLWPNEWHVTLSNPHVSKFAAMEAEEAGMNAKPSELDPALLTQALSAIPHHPHTPTLHTAAPSNVIDDIDTTQSTSEVQLQDVQML
jgi:hypothetical protein